MLAAVNEKNTDTAAALASLAVTPESLAGLVNCISDKTITGKQAKEVFAEMLAGGESAEAIITRKGMKRVVDPAVIASIVDEVFAENPKAVEDFRGGKTNVEAWLVGQVMKKSRGQADPQEAASLVRRKLR